MEVTISEAARSTAGILLITVVAVQSGGVYLLQSIRGRVPLTPFQITFARAGHAHAGALVILSLVIQLYADVVAFDGLLGALARSGVPAAAILMPAGFFLSSWGRGRTQPNTLIWLVYVGAVSLAAGVLTLGVGLLVSA